jgi:tRNA(Glu) U13 pseudouridine synthase TruD
MAKLQSYAMSVALTKLEHGFITTKAGAKCLVIPLEKNYLTEKDGAVYMQTDIVTMDEVDANGNWGFQVQKLPSDKWKELGSDKAKEIKLPYLGNLKIFEKKTTDAVEATVIETEEEIEDLPF